MSKIIVMSGLPGSGKSAKAKELAVTYNANIVSSDALRLELFGDENDQEHNEEIFTEMKKRVSEKLSRGQNVICDACNTSYKKRMAMIQQLRRYEPEFICYVVATDYETCFKNNRNRSRTVPDYVIKKMLLNYYVPQKFEGWNEIIISGLQKNGSLVDLFYGDNGICKIPHENPHHTLSIGDHCMATMLNMIQSAGTDFNLVLAATLHDIGKPVTKGFVNGKGEPCETAHYYQHHLASGYFALPYLLAMDNLSLDDVLEIVAMIDFHMTPYFWERENNQKMKNKYKRLWGEKLFGRIMLLHEADKKAH